MTDRILLPGSELPERSAERSVDKNRVIAEAAVPLFIESDESSDLAAARLEDASSLR